MRVLLIRPPYTDYEGTEPPRIGIPLGTLSVAASLEKRGHAVRIFDALTYLDRDGGRHFGASWQRILSEVKEFSPDVVGIANLFSTQLEKALVLPKMIKGVNPEIRIMVGGPHATVKPQDFLSAGCDFVIIGEGEEAAPSLLEYLEGRHGIGAVSGIAYMENGEIRTNKPQYIQDLDSLPFPAYHLVDMKMYFTLVFNGFSSRPQDPFYKPRREITMITSRGCPYNCTFCSIHPTMGYKHRTQSAEYVARHIEHVVRNYRVQFIHFEDDNLTLDQKRFMDILDKIKEKDIRIGWDTPNGVRADTLSRDLLEKMKQGGVSELRIAIESGVQQVLDEVVKKRLDLNRAVQAAKDCKELGIPLSAFYVIGIPGETKEDIRKTLEMAYRMMKEYNVTPHVNVAHPLVGTELYETARQKGYLIDEDYTKGFIFGTGRIKTEEFTPEDISRMSREFYKKVRRLYIIQAIKNPRTLLGKISTLVRYPRSTLRLIRIASRYAS